MWWQKQYNFVKQIYYKAVLAMMLLLWFLLISNDIFEDPFFSLSLNTIASSETQVNNLPQMK